MPRVNRSTPAKPDLRVFTTTLWEYPSQHYISKSGNPEQGDRDYAPEFPLHLAHKDMHLLMQTAYGANLALPLAATVKERYGDAKARGHGDEDFTAVMELAGGN